MRREHPPDPVHHPPPASRLRAELEAVRGLIDAGRLDDALERVRAVEAGAGRDWCAVGVLFDGRGCPACAPVGELVCDLASLGYIARANGATFRAERPGQVAH